MSEEIVHIPGLGAAYYVQDLRGLDISGSCIHHH